MTVNGIDWVVPGAVAKLCAAVFAGEAGGMPTPIDGAVPVPLRVTVVPPGVAAMLSVADSDPSLLGVKVTENWHVPMGGMAAVQAFGPLFVIAKSAELGPGITDSAGTPDAVPPLLVTVNGMFDGVFTLTLLNWPCGGSVVSVPAVTPVPVSELVAVPPGFATTVRVPGLDAQRLGLESDEDRADHGAVGGQRLVLAVVGDDKEVRRVGSGHRHGQRSGIDAPRYWSP